MSNVVVVPKETTKSVIMVPVAPPKVNLVTEQTKEIYVPLASKDNYGIVKIGDGILIQDGVVSFDKSEIKIESISRNGVLIAPDENKNVNIIITKTDVGLSNADNTSDLNKPISKLQQEALNKKLDKQQSIDEAGNILYVKPDGSIGFKRESARTAITNDGVLVSDYAEGLDFSSDFKVTGDNGYVNVNLSDDVKQVFKGIVFNEENGTLSFIRYDDTTIDVTLPFGNLETEIAINEKAIQTLEDRTTNLESDVATTITNVSLDASSGTFTFTKKDGTTLLVDTLLEKVVTNFRYDDATKELVLTLEDGSEQRVPMTAFIDDYAGVDGANITISVSNDNKISAVLKEGTVSQSQLNDELSDKIDLIQKRVALKSYIPSSEGVSNRYYPLATFPAYNDLNNRATLLVSGRLGGWEAAVAGNVIAGLGNRNGEGGVVFFATKKIDGTFTKADLVMYRQEDGTTIVYIKTGDYFVWDLELIPTESTIIYDGSYVTEPVGTLQWSLSTAADKITVSESSGYVGNKKLATLDDVDAAELRTTLDSFNFQPTDGSLMYVNNKAYIQGQFTYTNKADSLTSIGVDGTLVLNITGGDGIVVDTDDTNIIFKISDDVLDKTSIQEITGVKTFTEQIGLKNTNGDVDYIKHINNNFLISGASGASLLNIDEGLNKIYSFNRELAFLDDLDNYYLSFVNNEQTLTEDQQALIRSKIGAGSGSFSGDYADLGNKPILDTTSTDALEATSETISGTINLHKVAKTGQYSDLIDAPMNVVTTDTTQTITGEKTFTKTIVSDNTASSGSIISLYAGGNWNALGYNKYSTKGIALTLGGGNYVKTIMAQCYNVCGTNDEQASLGYSDIRWKDLYLSGNLSDGTNSITIANISSKDDLNKAIASLGTVFDLKGTKETLGDLPTEGNVIGDVWYVSSEQVGYIWLDDGEGARWERFGAPIDLSGYVTNDRFIELQNLVNTKFDKSGGQVDGDVKVARYSDNWSDFSWNYPAFNGDNIWSDGDNIYASLGTVQYVLDKYTSNWTSKIWSGLTDFIGYYVWSDGDNVYYSYGEEQYVLDKTTSTWNVKTWNGLTSFYAKGVWSDGDNIYYSYGTGTVSTDYILDKSTSTWNVKTWDNFNPAYGYEFWTDGDNVYYSYKSEQYVLDKSTSTWNTKTWTGLTSFEGQYVWFAGNNIYYSKEDEHYVLNKSKNGWDVKPWTGSATFSGRDVWTNGFNVYWSNSEYAHAVLDTNYYSVLTTNDVNYLPLSGGTMTGDITLSTAVGFKGDSVRPLYNDSEIAMLSDVPTTTSALTNDSGFLVARTDGDYMFSTVGYVTDMDLNAYYIPGSTPVDGTAAAHTPSNQSGVVLNMLAYAENGATQMYYEYATGRVYFRNGDGAVWTEWSPLALMNGDNTFTGTNTFTGVVTVPDVTIS